MKPIVCLLALTLASNVFAKDPTFHDDPASVYTGKKAPLVLNKDTRAYKSHFADLAQNPINFAGHYAVDLVGCGSGCMIGTVYDAQTGTSQLLLNRAALSYCQVGEQHLEMDIEHRANSRLLVITGAVGQNSDCGKHYFIEQQGKLIKIKTVRYQESDMPTND